MPAKSVEFVISLIFSYFHLSFSLPYAEYFSDGGGGKMHKKFLKKLKSKRSEGSLSDQTGHEGTFAFFKSRIEGFGIGLHYL